MGEKTLVFAKSLADSSVKFGSGGNNVTAFVKITAMPYELTVTFVSVTTRAYSSFVSLV